MLSSKRSSESVDGQEDPNRRRSYSDSMPVTTLRRSRIRNPFRSGSRHDRNTENSDDEVKDDTSSDDDGYTIDTTSMMLPQQSQLRKGSVSHQDRYTVRPAYAYPKAKMTREELRKEMNRTSSYFHDFRKTYKSTSLVGSVYAEILQCFGLPRRDFRKKGSAFCIMVCGRHAFKTDVMPPLSSPMLLSKHRRACVFPLVHAYSRIYVGVFAKSDGSKADHFIGRLVLDISRLRPRSTYDVTLPLRLSNQIYSRAKRGAIRCRIHLEWENERAALLSYLPKGKPHFAPHDSVTVRCSDNKAFQNVARAVHGQDLPGKFSMKLAKATAREINFVRVHVFRYLWKREIRSLTQWRCPIISLVVFAGWMHSVVVASLSYVPGHVISVLLLYLWKNYTIYILDQSYNKGFAMPYAEEMISSLLFGGRSIQSLQMERKDQREIKNESSNGEDDPDQLTSSLYSLAREFHENVPRIKRRRTNLSAFLGKDAVTFLVYMNYASSREDAVALGLRLQHELGLFRHIRGRPIDFKDGDVIFVFCNFDTSAYIFRTHKPWFNTLSRCLFSENYKSKPDVHMEFPFASSIDHPRFTVQDSVYSREPMNMMAAVQDGLMMEDAGDDDMDADDDVESDSVDSDEEDIGDEGVRSKDDVVDSFTASFGDITKSQSVDSNGQLSVVLGSSTPPQSPLRSAQANGVAVEPLEEDNVTKPLNVTGHNVLILPKPPNQDIDVIPKQDKTLSQLLHKSSIEIHAKFGHLFHDKAYTLRRDSVPRLAANELLANPSVVTNSKKQLLRKTSTVSLSSLPQAQVTEKKHLVPLDESAKLKAKQDLYDKLLRSGKYSSSNVIMGKLALIVQPLVEIAQTFLASFRAGFNVMTWQDPFLTLWVSIIGILLVPILHLFPWRVVLGISGVVFFGPQNWAFRLTREYLFGIEEANLDVVIQKHNLEDDEVNKYSTPVFSSFAPDNRPIRSEVTDASQIKEVAIPHSQLLYRRCYDWPPEPEYARVSETRAPENDPEAERLLNADLLDTFGTAVMESTSDHQTRDSVSIANRRHWARWIMNRSVAGVKHVPTILRSSRKKDL